VYATKDVTRVSWFQPAGPALSLSLLAALPSGAHVVDVGAGASRLADELVARGVHVTVLDVSARALEIVRARLGERAEYVVHDVTTWSPQPAAGFDAWHDRAVFHFLTDADDQARYAAVAARAVRPGGTLVVQTFAIGGPTMCSDLACAQHDAASIARVFGAHFTLTRSEREAHATPAGKTQDFAVFVLERTKEPA
jgi:SAM-dependent methyltransferase